jgi:hypothetical protein
MLLHQVQRFSAASMVLDLSGVMISAFYRRCASALCRELRLSAFVQSMSAAQTAKLYTALGYVALLNMKP